MELKFKRANPHDGQQSCLLKFEDRLWSQTPCILIDAGKGIDLDSLLDKDEYLAGVLLTHAHADHHYSLEECLRDSAPIYASTDTASILPQTLQEAEKQNRFTQQQTSAIKSQIEPVTDWTTVVGGVKILPITTGHTPGACGFVIQFGQDNDQRHILVTGDFTTENVAGYGGIQHKFPVDIDVLLLNASTAPTEYRDTTGALSKIIDRRNAGDRTLVTTSSLTGVQYAYLLGEYADQSDSEVTIRIVGQAAKYYSDLGYETPNVEAVPAFDSTTDVLGYGDICIASPQNPSIGGSSQALYQALKDDSDSAIIRITDQPPGYREKTESQDINCTQYTFTQNNHPSESQIDQFVRSIKPIHLVALHCSDDRLRDRYTFTYTWSNDQSHEFMLYDGSDWVAPNWVTSHVSEMIRSNNPSIALEDQAYESGMVGEFDDYERTPTPMFNSEMVSIDSLPALQSPAAIPDKSKAEPVTALQANVMEKPTPTDGGSVLTTYESPVSQDIASEGSVRVVDTGDGDYLLKVIDGEVPGEQGDVLSITYQEDNSEEDRS